MNYNKNIVVSMMSEAELIAWCKERGFPEKLAALLSTFTPDLEELNEWEISIDEYNDAVFSINGTEYQVLTSSELEDAEEITKDNIIDYYSQDIPDEVLRFVDWDAFFRKNVLEIEDILPNGDSINFNGQWYYYGDV